MLRLPRSLIPLSMVRRPPDLLLFLAFLTLTGFGGIMLMSASSVLGHDLQGDPYFFARHQLFYGIIPGLVTLVVTMCIPYRVWWRAVLPFLVTVFVLLLLVFVSPFGLTYGGASRWVAVGPISVQPAEFAKFAVILYLAALMANRERTHGTGKGTLLPFLIVVGLVGALIASQPDIGTLGVVAGAAILTYYAGGGKVVHLAGIMASAAALLVILIQAAPYRLARFATFLHPELDPKGIGYQVHQALLAVGSGGLWGLGFGRSRQKFQYLPEPAGDTIFAIMGEELGFIRLLVLLSLYAFVIYRGYRIARRAPDTFGRLLAAGITSWLFVQSVVHIGANLALTPLTGIPLPFISYGGSSLVIALGGAGILLNISRRTS